MAVARLVALSGPDKGQVFEVPLRGGGIGREAGNLVQLSDLSVSRSHCSLQLRDGALVLCDGGGRNRTVVNGEPMALRGVHALKAGDEITVGKTRLLFTPLEDKRESGGPRSATPATKPVRVTMEIGSRELLANSRGMPGSEGERARRHLDALVQIGDLLRVAKSRDKLINTACEQALSALSGQRAYLMLADSRDRITMRAIARSRDARDGAASSLPGTLIDKVARAGRVLNVDTDTGPAVAAPVYRFAASGATQDAEVSAQPIGLLCVERHVGRSFDDIDATAAVALAQLLSAALFNHETHAALTHENHVLSEQVGGREFVGESAPALAVRAFVAKVGPSDATVLLTGESGSGKEMVARAVHQASRRAHAPFIAVNCAALTESLIESELFGHEKGAFTGATDRKLGRFELADGGTLFLDEVGELPLACQTKFLRVLEEQVFERVGGSRSIAVDVRVVAATNRDLLAMSQRGGFREDLYYRLSVIHTIVPPLRERQSDIARLAQHFLTKLRHQVPRRVEGFSAEAMRLLEQHRWPGNVRELKNAVERAIVLGDGGKIQPDDLPPHVRQPSAAQTLANAHRERGRMRMPTAPFAQAPGYPPASVDAQSPYPPARTTGPGAPGRYADGNRFAVTPPAGTQAMSEALPLRELEKRGIQAALRATGGNKAQAAQLLEIDRSTLYKKIKDYNIK